MIRCVLLVGVLFSLAACQPESDQSHTPADTMSDTSDVVAAPEGGEIGRAAPSLALDPEGLRIVDPAVGSTQVLTFGTDMDEVLAAVTSLYGEPADRGVNSECGEGPLEFVTWPDGLSLNSSDGRFRGWGVYGDVEGAERHTTVSEIGIGSTRAELEAAYDIRTGESSLGTEFAAGGLHGVLGGSGSSAEVTSLWSGSACIFR